MQNRAFGGGLGAAVRAGARERVPARHAKARLCWVFRTAVGARTTGHDTSRYGMWTLALKLCRAEGGRSRGVSQMERRASRISAVTEAARNSRIAIAGSSGGVSPSPLRSRRAWSTARRASAGAAPACRSVAGGRAQAVAALIGPEQRSQRASEQRRAGEQAGAVGDCSAAPARPVQRRARRPAHRAALDRLGTGRAHSERTGELRDDRVSRHRRGRHGRSASHAAGAAARSGSPGAV